MTRWAFAGTLLASSCLAAAPTPRPLDIRSPLQDKTFYVLSLIERSQSATAALRKEQSLASILERRRQALHGPAQSCPAVACIDAMMRWTDAEISVVADALKTAYTASDDVHRLVEQDLKESGAYLRAQSKDGAQLLVQAWIDAARAMNEAIDVYGEGLSSARYATMDPPAFDVKAPEYAHMVHTVTTLLAEDVSAMTLFFQPTLQYALHLLEINSRDEAGRHEPLEQTDNAAAVQRISNIDWSKFPYTVIVVPGEGPDRLTRPLAPEGRLRIEIAARRWRQQLAPLILVSGGYAHPNQTTYAEAVEMKRSLIADFGVPENAILIEPQARHTTTNMRNAAREMYRYGLPFDRAALVSTDSYQSTYIESVEFAKRCEAELGYVPYRILRRLSPFDLEWKPNIESLQIDAVADLLDP